VSRNTDALNPSASAPLPSPHRLLQNSLHCSPRKNNVKNQWQLSAQAHSFSWSDITWLRNAPQCHAACQRDTLVNQSLEDSSPGAAKLSVHLTHAADEGTLLYFRYSEERPGQPVYRFIIAPHRWHCHLSTCYHMSTE